MEIFYQPTSDLSQSATITFDNMRSYYEHYAVDWEQPKILEQISGLESWDILYSGEVVGALRLEYDNEVCYLRDLQICSLFQNQGIGAAALAEASRLAGESNATQVKLKVFKISPAQHLYKRSGFVVEKEDARFYYMSQSIS